MIAFILFLVTLNIASATLFDEFQLNASSTGYIINGTYTQSFLGLSAPAAIVIDGPGNRYLYDFGYFGKYSTNANGSFVYDQLFFPGICRQIVGSTFATEYEGYEQAVAINDKENKVNYFGSIMVGNGCGHPVSILIETKNDIITTLNIGVRVVGPFGVNNSIICFPLVAIVEMDINTLDKRSNRDPYFDLPASCSTPVDFCLSAYPPGNPCGDC